MAPLMPSPMIRPTPIDSLMEFLTPYRSLFARRSMAVLRGLSFGIVGTVSAQKHWSDGAAGLRSKSPGGSRSRAGLATLHPEKSMGRTTPARCLPHRGFAPNSPAGGIFRAGRPTDYFFQERTMLRGCSATSNCRSASKGKLPNSHRAHSGRAVETMAARRSPVLAVGMDAQRNQAEFRGSSRCVSRTGPQDRNRARIDRFDSRRRLA